MAETLKVATADNEYTVVQTDGKLVALRYGKAWRDLTGDNLVLSLAQELTKAREQRQALGRSVRAGVTSGQGTTQATIGRLELAHAGRSDRASPGKGDRRLEPCLASSMNQSSSGLTAWRS